MLSLFKKVFSVSIKEQSELDIVKSLIWKEYIPTEDKTNLTIDDLEVWAVSPLDYSYDHSIKYNNRNYYWEI